MDRCLTIWIYISGNLAAESLFMIGEKLTMEYPLVEISFISDGYFPTLDTYQKSKIICMDLETYTRRASKGDLLILGIMTPGSNERKLISISRNIQVFTIAILNDIGGSGTKFYEDNEIILPDLICVCDIVTRGNLITAGVPCDRLLELGSIYLDGIPTACEDRRIRPYRLRSIGYLSVPNEMDQKYLDFDLGYTEELILGDLLKIVSEKADVYLTIRDHPKENRIEMYQSIDMNNVKFERFDHCSISDYVLRHDLIVSSYSTGILVAAKLGVRCVSYQPKSKQPMRTKLYSALNIPVITNLDHLNIFLREGFPPAKDIECVLFNPNSSLDVFVKVVKNWLTKDVSGYNYTTDAQAVNISGSSAPQ